MTSAKSSPVVAAVSLAWGLLIAVAAYAVVRSIQFFVYPDPNPATLVWSAHTGYFWRAWTVGYAGGMATFIAVLLVRADVDRAVRALVPAVCVAAALLSLQAVFLP
jgi:hypothetical protein